MERSMTVKSGLPGLDSGDVLEPTPRLVVIRRKKDIQGQRRDVSHAISQATPSTTYALSVVVPTRNERDNIVPLLEALHGALHDLHVEVIFVDDSDDDTPTVVEDAAKTMSSS